MISILLQGGLGNQLFQIAAASSIAKKKQYQLCLPDTPITHHSKQNYYETILQKWKPYRSNVQYTRVHEKSYEFQDWSWITEFTELCGYFQNYKYIPSDFADLLVIPETRVLDGAFLHIRGGDYVNNPFHHIDLTKYYETAIRMFPSHTKFYVFTNDVPYAKTLSFLNGIEYEFVEEQDEVTCLSLMKNCKLGGICANSTFSWWGAYLNRYARTLVLPSKWFNNSYIYIEGYFFPGSTICQV
jgi:hypothetical protein